MRLCRPCNSPHRGRIACQRPECQRWLRAYTEWCAAGKGEPPPEFDWQAERAKLSAIKLKAPKSAHRRKSKRR